MPPKVHTELDRKVHAQLKHLREKLGDNATLSDALALAIASSKDSVAVKIDPKAPGRAYFKDMASAALPKEIKASTLNLAGLLDLATTITGKPAQALLEDGLVSACSLAIAAHFRARAGQANAKGASDHKIALAFKTLSDQGEIPSPSKIRNLSGCYLNTIKRWLAEHAAMTPPPTTPPPSPGRDIPRPPEPKQSPQNRP
jgi:hypothetical protein